MIKGDAVLVLKEEGERLFIKTEYLTSDAIPETLNGESGFHVYHVRKMTELILRKMGLDEETVIQMSIASSLHDIGKREVPKSILDFPGTLSPLQYDIIKKHSVFGEEIIKQADTSEIDEKIISYAKEIARNHHERIDGTGYPDGLKGESIPVSASAVAIADAFDALTSQRSYKDALSTDVALQMISSGMCGSFDEKLISALIAVVGDSALVEIRNKLADSRAVVSTAPLRPKKILLIGNTGYVNESFIEKAFPNGKVTVVGNTDLEGKSTLKLFKIRKPSVKAILETYEFDFIVYFSNDLSFGVEKKSDAEELRELLKYSVETGQTARIIHLASLESAFKNKSDSSILSSSKEKLVDYYKKNHGLSVRTVRIPYLYSGTLKGDFLYEIFTSLYNGERVRIPSGRNSRTFFLSMTDLAELILRLSEKGDTEGGALTVNDDFRLPFSAIGKKLEKLVPDSETEYLSEVAENSVEASNKAIRSEYGWFSKISIVEDLEEEYEKFLLTKENRALTLLDKIRRFFEERSLLFKTIELFVVFLISELLMLLTDSAVVFSIVDFRTIFIVIIATVHGLWFGLSASALSSLAWLVAKVMTGANLLTIFYEPTNWLAFVFYFLVGALCGYVKLKSDDLIRFVTEENRFLEDKLVFTREIYSDTRTEKNDLKKQIISSKDSFGKIFDITRRLDTVEPQKLYLKAIDTFEEILENKSLTIYSMGENTSFARLEVASRDIRDTASRSINTDTYKEIMDYIKEGEVWKNTELLRDFPMYAAGVFRKGELKLIIFLWHSKPEQRSLYYVNLFRILRDLVEMSLLRAYDYNLAIYEKQFINGTRIMNEEAFKDCLANYESLADRKVFTFVTLVLDFGDKTPEEINALISSKVRQNDAVGLIDGKVVVLLTQATERDLEFILPRFESLGAEIEVKL